MKLFKSVILFFKRLEYSLKVLPRDLTFLYFRLFKRFYPKFNTLKNFKDVHLNERCFIVATGPSLSVKDVNKLKNEYTFSMNSIHLIFNETDWKPTYYGVQDIRAFRFFRENINFFNPSRVFVGFNNFKDSPSLNFNFNYYLLNFLHHSGPNPNKKIKFSFNADSIVYDGFSITYSLIQIAVFMGFKEIYLLGVDNIYTQGKNNHFKNGYINPIDFNATTRMEKAFLHALKVLKDFDVKIFNSTKGGNLEVFERVEFDKIKFK